MPQKTALLVMGSAVFLSTQNPAQPGVGGGAEKNFSKIAAPCADAQPVSKPLWLRF
jgi:hypothetical protein